MRGFLYLCNMKHLILILMVLVGCKKETPVKPRQNNNKIVNWTFIGNYKLYEYIAYSNYIQTYEWNVVDTLVKQKYLNDERGLNVLIYSEKPTKVKVLRNDSVYFDGIIDRLAIKSK